MAAIRKNCLSITILVAYSGDAYSNSEAVRSIIAVTASHKLISDKLKGKNTASHPKKN